MTMTTDREGGGITSKHSPPKQVQTRERKETELLLTTTTTTMIETGTGTGFVVDAKKPECDDNTIKKLYNKISRNCSPFGQVPWNTKIILIILNLDIIYIFLYFKTAKIDKANPHYITFVCNASYCCYPVVN